jgi:hypothetical protein
MVTDVKAGKKVSRLESLTLWLNGAGHKRMLLIFMFIVIAHLAEHVAQAYQIYGMGMHRQHALGALGMVFPWLVSSEWLHYGYALVMLIGLAVLRPAFVGTARVWWTIALAIQVWHHFEHLLLLGQAITKTNLFGATAPTSILQLIVPRVELHLFYNSVVFVPMIIGVFYHMYPPAKEVLASTCSCARRSTKVKEALPS